MKLPISWAMKTPIPSSELSSTGKGLHPGNGECFKGSLSRRHKGKLALRDTSQTGAPERPRPHNPKKRVKRSLSHSRKRRAALSSQPVAASLSRATRRLISFVTGRLNRSACVKSTRVLLCQNCVKTLSVLTVGVQLSRGKADAPSYCKQLDYARTYRLSSSDVAVTKMSR